MEKETRDIGEIREIQDDQGIVKAYLTAWDTVDAYNSTFKRGAFKRSFKERNPKLIWNHKDLAGKILEAGEDDYGPYAMCQFNMDTSSGRDYFSHVKAGDVSAFSFGFRSNKDRIKNGIREIMDVDVLECGPVLFPANDNAVITHVRGNDKMSEDINKEIEALNKTFEAYKEANDKAIQEARDNGGHATAETREKVDKIEADITDLRKGIERLEQAANRPNIPAKSDDEQRSENEIRSFLNYVRHGRKGMEPDELRTLSSISDGDGGVLVPETLLNQIVMNAYDMAALRPIVNVMNVSSDSVRMPTMSKPTVSWGRQLQAVTEQNITTGQERILVNFLQALYKITEDLLADSAFNLESYLPGKFGMAVAEAEDDAIIVGDDDNEPLGILTDSRVQANYTASGVSDNIYDPTDNDPNGIDAMLDCLYSLNSTYRRNATWAWNSSTEAAIRKLKDDDGNYHWQPSVQAGKPNTFLGRPVVNPEGAPDIAANAFPILVGDFSMGYTLIDRSGMAIRRLDELYAATFEVGFILKKRLGGQVVLPEAFACIKCATS